MNSCMKFFIQIIDTLKLCFWDMIIFPNLSNKILENETR